ncbi:unnamed protein product, partial [Iphiclides podalirius]
MAKRSASTAFDTEASTPNTKEGKKHSLDSDEEDSGAEEEKKNVLNADDIEGEEEGVAGMEGEITITPFNMKEELEEGHFDTQGHYHWKKEKEIHDGWLDNIDWVKVKGRPEDKYKIHKDNDKDFLDDSESEEDEIEEKFNIIDNYKEIVDHMQPKETISKAIQRLGASSKISSAERWKRKKAGIIDEGSKTVTRITELANQILTKTDMYADDFDQKEKDSIGNKTTSDKNEDDDGPEEVKWEFKWNQNDDSEMSGPHSTEQMSKSPPPLSKERIPLGDGASDASMRLVTALLNEMVLPYQKRGLRGHEIKLASKTP